MRRSLTALGLVFTGIMLCAQHAQAANGTWTNLAGGVWSTTGNWLSGAVADGTDAVADFSTLNITNAVYVNNDTARTVGTILFQDKTLISHEWYLTNSPLTLATGSGTPVISVSNSTATISSVLQGTQGFSKDGAGMLNISGTNTLAGDITVNAGVLQNVVSGLRYTAGRVIVASGAQLYTGGSGQMSNAVFLAGTGNNDDGALKGTGNFTLKGPITLLTDTKIQHRYNNFWLNGDIIGTNKNLRFAVTGGQPGITVNGSMSLGSGSIFVSAGGTLTVNTNNSYSGGTTVTNSTLKVGHVNALGTGGLTVNRSGVVDLNTKSISIASLSGAGGSITDNNVAAGTTTLTVTQSVTTAFSGMISNGASRVVALTMNGTGLLKLVGTNTYSGATTISNGILGVSGSLANSAVTVCTGGAFAAGSTGVVDSATLGGTLTFENNSKWLVDVTPVAADFVSVAGNVSVVSGTVKVELSGDQSKSGSWKILESTAGTVSGSFVLSGGRSGAKLSQTATAVVLTIPPWGTMVKIF